MKPKIVIIIEGGSVQSVAANQEIEYVVIDYDIKLDDFDANILIGPSEADSVADPVRLCFNANDNREGEIYHLLQDVKF